MRPLLLVTTGLLAACASTKATHPAEAASERPAPDAGVQAPAEDEAARQARLEALFQRESQPAPEAPFTLREHPLTLESSQPITVTRDGALKGTTLSIGLGASTPMTCTLLDEPLQVGSFVSRMLSNIQASLELTRVRPAGIEVIERSPAVFLEIGYASVAEGRRSVGQLKLMAYASDEAPMFCLFDEPGYTQTFHRVAGAAAARLARALEAPGERPSFRSVDLTHIQGMPVGFSKSLWRRQPNGTVTIVSVGAMLVPRTPVDWLTTDHETSATIAKDGALREKRFLAVTGAQLSRELLLRRTKPGTYRYSGTVQGKAIEGVLKTKGQKDLPSELHIARRLKRELLSGKTARLELEDYLPDANPAALTLVAVKKMAGPRDVTMELGPMTLDVTLDASGFSEKAAVRVGPMTVIEERAFVEGSPE